MDSTKLPGGFQIAFLIVAGEFFVMLAARWIAPAVGWPEPFFNTLGHVLLFPVALIVVFAAPPTRRLLMQQLAVPLRPAAVVETALVVAAKACVPVAVVGAAVLIHFHVSSGDPVAMMGMATTRTVGDARYFSALGLFSAAIAISLGPFTEEVLFRGVLYRCWHQRYGWMAAMLLTSIAFGIVHPGDFIRTFIGSMFYVCLLRRTGTLWAPIAAHIAYNLLVSWPLLGHVIMVRPDGDAALLATWWPHLACLAIVALVLPAYVALAHRVPR